MTENNSNPINPPGFVPIFGQGLEAKESQLGAVGTKEWLKYIKLHKYWPLVSHWSYWEMMGMTADNIDYYMAKAGGSGITRGGQGKLLRSIEELRKREHSLYSIAEDIACSKTSVDKALSYIQQVVGSPMPTSQEEPLPTLVVHTFLQVMEFCSMTGAAMREQRRMEKIQLEIKANPVLERAEVRLRETLLSSVEIAEPANNNPNAYSAMDDLFSRRSRNFSLDSGFEEPASEGTSSSNLVTWPTGSNAVMFALEYFTENNELLKYSPFVQTTSSSQEENMEMEQHIIQMFQHLMS